MLADAIRDIEDRVRKADGERRRRSSLRAPLRQAEAHAHRLEELLLKGQSRVPADFADEIRLFVQRQSPRLAPGTSSPTWTHTASLLDLLFDVQEAFQFQSAAPVAA